MKPGMSLLRILAEKTASRADDEILNQVEHSTVYKGFMYVAEWLGSVEPIGR
jgi:hypothetical protein